MRHDLVLDGHGVRPVPLEVEHAAALAAIVDEAVWRGMTTPTPRGPGGWPSRCAPWAPAAGSIHSAWPAGCRPTPRPPRGWPPNLPVARAALEPRGIPVAASDPDTAPAVAMPFADGRFDLVLNRQVSFDPAELVRVLRLGGVLLMQQEGGDDAVEVHDWFGGPVRVPQIRLEPVARALQEAGLVVDRLLHWHGSPDGARLRPSRSGWTGRTSACGRRWRMLG